MSIKHTFRNAITAMVAGLFLFLFLSVSVYGQDKKSFHIMTYNIRLNIASDGDNAWPLRKDKVAALLRFHQADIFGVQEALSEQMNDLKTSLPEFEAVGVGRDDGKEAGEFSAVFFRKSRFEKLDFGTFWLSQTPDKPGLGWDAQCNRVCTWVKLKDKMTKKIFYEFNTHFDHVGKTARIESAKLIIKFMNDINKQNLPVILTGDFNSTKDSPAIQTILGTLSDSRDKSQTPSYGPVGTFTGFAVKPSETGIDFIFINQKVVVLRHGVLTDNNGSYYPSDHQPVIAEVEIQ